MIRKYAQKDLPECAGLLVAAYNNEQWKGRWSFQDACSCLLEFVGEPRFVGYVLEADGKIAAAAFAKERTCDNGSELFVEDFFVDPAFQRKGFGTALLGALEDHVRENGLEGITLLTNRFLPSSDFYRKHGFSEAGHVQFLYKVLPKPEGR